MMYTFSPAKDLKTLENAIVALYGESRRAEQLARYRELLDGFTETFGEAERVAIFSAPGRTEIGGNHTDHQHGKVLAGSITMDIIAVVAPRHDHTICMQSKGFRRNHIDLNDLSLHESEIDTSNAIVRGVAAKFAEMGCQIEGFNAYTTSTVRKGSGLSSSAAFEVLIATILNTLFFDSQCSPADLAGIGQFAENTYYGKPSGLLDQMASSLGGMVTIDFADAAAPNVARIDFDFAAAGYALCIIDSGADHADLTHEYAAVPGELKAVCAHFGKNVLREVEEAAFYADLPALRAEVGDRAVLRAIHVYEENRRVEREVAALRAGDVDAFLREVRSSGLSSWRSLQNVVPVGCTEHQEVALALTLAENLLAGRGACRVHGGGFAGTIQAFVPHDMLPRFQREMERVLGEGSCHILTIRPVGGTRLV